MDFWTPSHRKDKKSLYYLTKYYYLLFITAGCVSGCRIVENELLVGTVDRVDDIADFSLSRTDTAVAIAETFHLRSTPSLRG
jgi:hypothetical protein